MELTSKASIPESRGRVSYQVDLPQSRWYNGLEDTEHFGGHLATVVRVNESSFQLLVDSPLAGVSVPLDLRSCDNVVHLSDC
jgi:hypothetical protein